MIDFIKISILLFCLSGMAQERLTYIDSDKIFEDIDNLKQNENYNGIIDLIDNINKNDSIYWSMQINKSYYYLVMEQYRDAIDVANAGLSHNDKEINKSFFINKALAYSKIDSIKTSILVLDEALKQYPANYEIFYSKGIYYELLGMYDNAIKAYKISSSLNPFNPDVHLKLGNLCLRQRMTAQALMCFNTYLMLNPDGTESFNVLKSLNNVMSQDNQTNYIEGFLIESDHDAYEELNMILDNRVALSDNYSFDNEINIVLNRQNHVLLEYLKNINPNNDYWGNTYVKLFQWIQRNNLFDDFAYTISYSIQNEKFKKIVEKNRDNVISFYQKMKDQLDEIYANYEFQLEENGSGIYPYYASYKLDGLGPKKNGTEIGMWKYFDDLGSLLLTGQFDESGERTGDWVMHYPNGRQKETAFYDNGKLNGENQAYYENGNTNYKTSYSRDTLDGKYTRFNKNGALVEQKEFSKGILSGEFKTFYPIGEKYPGIRVSYIHGNAVGPAIEYSPNGNVIYTVDYKDNLKTGLEKTFYSSGGEKLISQYVLGIKNGKEEQYYPNGKLMSEGQLKDEKYIGAYKKYRADGMLMEKYNYQDGELNGLYFNYYPDGSEFSEFEFRKGELIGYKFFNHDKSILKEGRKKAGQFYYEGYSELGQVNAKGMYDVEGGKTGEWQFFNNNGLLSSKEQYEQNTPVGKSYTYYTNGQIKEISNYSEGQLHGYYEGFAINGQIESHGYYKNGKLDKEWRTYFQDGTLESIQFYHKGQQHGEQLYYSVEGTLIQKSLYRYGTERFTEYYDFEGNQIGSIDLENLKDQQTVEMYHDNGKLRSSTTYLHNILNGPYLEKDPLGNLEVQGQYLNGEQHGTWKYYYPNGHLKLELNFDNGDLHGTYRKFYENGKLSDLSQYQSNSAEGLTHLYAEDGETDFGSIEYLNDEIHGKRKFRDQVGNLQLIRFYQYGTLIGYSYLGKDGKEIPMIPLKNESGKINSYYSNGNIAREMTYEKGELTGDYKVYFMDGGIQREHFNLNDETHGIQKIYFKSGKIKEENNFSHGTPIGETKKYDENGNLRESIKYRNGEKSGENVFYDPQGNVAKIDVYFNGKRIKTIHNEVVTP